MSHLTVTPFSTPVLSWVLCSVGRGLHSTAAPCWRPTAGVAHCQYSFEDVTVESGPHEAGANYFSGGVQPGPRLGSFPFSLLFPPPLPPASLLFWGVLPKRQFTLIWHGRQMLGTVAWMCGVTSISWGGKCGFLICSGLLERRNGHDDSNSWQEFERKFKRCSIFGSSYFYHSLLYCCEIGLSSFQPFC